MVWISLIVGSTLGVVGIYYAKKAFVEADAQRGRQSSRENGKFQNIAIELREFELDNLPGNIRFTAARDLLSDTTKKLYQILSPFEKDAQFIEKIEKLWGVLSQAKLDRALIAGTLRRLKAKSSRQTSASESK